MLTPDRFLQPRGRIASSLFAGENGQAIDNRFRTYIDIAYEQEEIAALAEEGRDKPAALYVYYLAYTDVAQAFAETPTSATLQNQGSESYSPQSRDYFERQAASYLAQYQVAITPDEVEVDPMPSGAVPNVYRY